MGHSHQRGTDAGACELSRQLGRLQRGNGCLAGTEDGVDAVIPMSMSVLERAARAAHATEVFHTRPHGAARVKHRDCSHDKWMLREDSSHRHAHSHASVAPAFYTTTEFPTQDGGSLELQDSQLPVICVHGRCTPATHARFCNSSQCACESSLRRRRRLPGYGST